MKLNNKKGAVLLVATFIILVSSILIIGFLEAMTSETEILRNQKNACITMYIADSGVEAAIYDLLNGGTGNIARTEFPNTADDNSYYTVTQTGVTGNVYTVESLGEYGDFEYEIEAKIKVTSPTAGLQYWKKI
ncbi:MAG: hypothetical protein ABIH09_03945 [Candidatus Omnitrophota bacterium]